MSKVTHRGSGGPWALGMLSPPHTLQMGLGDKDSPGVFGPGGFTGFICKRKEACQQQEVFPEPLVNPTQTQV